MSDDDDGVAVLGVAQRATPSATIDLCNDDEDDQILMAQPLQKKRRQAAEYAKMTTLPSDFVRSVDRNGALNEDDDNEMRYRRALGPVRMEFLPSTSGDWPETTAPHAFGKQRTAKTTKNRTLFSELLEYQLNLPINWSSSIFCRVPESRSDLLRVLITGKWNVGFK
jgi:hypothetical protein